MARTAALLVTLLILAGVSARADDKKTDTAAMMAAMAKHATPGDGHKKLEPLAGSWTYTGKMWMDPAAPPTEMAGTIERKWVLDGRFMQEDVYGDFFGMKFHGIGFAGYDNTLKKYVGTWVDNMTTSVMTSQGTMDPAGKVLTSTSTSVDPLTGKAHIGKDVLTIVSKDEHTMVMHKVENGKEIKVMELHCKRAKK